MVIKKIDKESDGDGQHYQWLNLEAIIIYSIEQILEMKLTFYSKNRETLII